MLDPASWLAQAQALRLGQSRRVPHDCGEGSTLKIERNEDGWRAWCHRCQDKGWVPVPEPSLAERLARLERMRVSDASIGAAPDGGLPLPQVREVSAWPAGAALWLYRAGLGRLEIGRLGIYYHPPSDRVILPHGTYYQARAFQRGRMPKYLGPTPRPSDLLATWGSAAVPTLTEDMLSAMKVGLVAEGWAVLGTSVSNHMIAALMRRGTRVNVWLDPDAAGRKGAAKIVKQLRAYGLEVRNIVSERDPKLHTRDDIKEILA